MKVHNEEALQEFEALARSGGKPFGPCDTWKSMVEYELTKTQPKAARIVNLTVPNGKPLPYAICPGCGEWHQVDRRVLFGMPILVCPNFPMNEVQIRDLHKIKLAVRLLPNIVPVVPEQVDGIKYIPPFPDFGEKRKFL